MHESQWTGVVCAAFACIAVVKLVRRRTLPDYDTGAASRTHNHIINIYFITIL